MYKCVMDHAIRLLYSLVAVVSSRQGEIFVAFRGPLCYLCGKIKKKNVRYCDTMLFERLYIFLRCGKFSRSMLASKQVRAKNLNEESQ